MPRERARKTCEQCRVSRTACYSGAQYECCYRCDAKKATFAGGQREDNDNSELRSQLLRFEDVIDSLRGTAASQREASKDPVASTSRETLDDDPVEVHDLVGALTALCFSADGVASGPKASLTDDQLVHDAQSLLSRRALDGVYRLPESGFVFEPHSPDAAISELINGLPPEEEVMWLLNGVYMDSWTRGLHGLFYPTWPVRVKALLRSGLNDQPERHLHLLAELFGVLAIATAVLKNGRDLEALPMRRDERQRQVDRYVELLQQALTLGNYVEAPSLESTRALCLLAELYLACSSCTSRLARGLAILPLSISALNQLGFLAAESEFKGRETPEEQYSRRALVCTLLRLDCAYSQAYGRRALTDPKTWRVEPPVEPQDEDLPLEARDSPFRMTAPLIHFMAASYRIAQLQQEMIIDVFDSGTKGVNYSAVRDYADRIDTLWQEVVRPGWNFFDDPATGARRWGDPSDIDTFTRDEFYARNHTMAKLMKLVLTLHRPFIHPEAVAVDGAVDYAWHRSVVLTICRNFMVIYQDNAIHLGPFSSIESQGFDAIVAICVLIFSDPGSPEVAKHRHELSQALHGLVKSPVAPPAVHKLGRICAFLLDQPNVRKAEHQEDGRDGAAQQKRARKGLFGDLPPFTATITNEKEELVRFSFNPAHVAAVPLPALEQPFVDGEELRRKLPRDGPYLPERSTAQASVLKLDASATAIELSGSLSYVVSPASPLIPDSVVPKDLEDFVQWLQSASA